MPGPILITSIGRTATKWLAACLGWDHEPRVFRGRAVSPTHLHKMAIDKWEPPEGTKFTVIIRDPDDQMLSVINRWHAVRSGYLFRDTWETRLPHYLATLDRLIEEGAGLMQYEDMTHCHPDLLVQLSNAGMPANNVIWSTEDFNTHPKVIIELPAWARATAWTLYEHYEKWQNVRDTRSA